MGKDKATTSNTTNTPIADPATQAMNALYGANLGGIMAASPGGRGMAEYAQGRYDLAMPGPAELATLQNIYNRQSAPLINPVEQAAIQTGMQGLDRYSGMQDAAANFMMGEYGRTKDFQEGIGNIMMGNDRAAQGRIDALTQQALGAAASGWGNAQGAYGQARGDVSGYYGSGQAGVNAAMGQGRGDVQSLLGATQGQIGNYYGQTIGNVQGAYGGGQAGVGRYFGDTTGRIGVLGNEAQALMTTDHPFAQEAARYFGLATDPTGQVAAAKARLEDVVAPELANRLTAGGFGGVRGGGYGEALARGGSDLVLPIMDRVAQNQATAGQSYLGANTARMQIGTNAIGDQIRALAALGGQGMQSESALAAALMGQLGETGRTGMTTSAQLGSQGMANLANLAAQAMQSQGQMASAGMGASASLGGNLINAATENARTGVSAAQAGLSAANQLYGTQTQGALGYLGNATDLFGKGATATNQFLGNAGAESGRALQAAGLGLEYGQALDQRETQRYLMGLQAAAAPRQAEQGEWLRQGQVLAPFLSNIPFTPLVGQQSNTRNVQEGDIWNDIMTLAAVAAKAYT